MSSDDFKSFITAVFLLALVVLGFNYFFPQQTTETTVVTEEAQTPVAEEMPEKMIIILLNKIDLVPYSILEQVFSYLSYLSYLDYFFSF